MVVTRRVQLNIDGEEHVFMQPVEPQSLELLEYLLQVRRIPYYDRTPAVFDEDLDRFIQQLQRHDKTQCWPPQLDHNLERRAPLPQYSDRIIKA